MTEERILLEQIFRHAVQTTGNPFFSEAFPVKNAIIRHAYNQKLLVRELVSMTGDPRLVAWDLARTAFVAESGQGNEKHPTLFVHSSRPSKVSGDPGATYRELCLALASALDANHNISVLCASVSGTEGPNAISAAFADGSTRQRGKKIGLDLATSQKNHTGQTFLAKLGDLFHLDAPPSFNSIPAHDIVLILVGAQVANASRSVTFVPSVHPLYRL